MKKGLIALVLLGLVVSVLPAQVLEGSLDRLPDPGHMALTPLEMPPPKMERFQLTNGMPCLLVEDHTLPVIGASVAFQAGGLEDPAGKAGLAKMTAELLREGGIKTASPLAVNQQIDALAAAIEFDAGSESTVGTFHGFKRDAEMLFSLFAEMVRAPRFDTSRFAWLKGQMLAELKEREDQPVHLALRGIQQLLYNGKGLGQLPTPASLHAITLADIQSFAQHYLVPERCVLGVMGDLSLLEAKAYLEKHFGNWPGAPTTSLARKGEETLAKPGCYLKKKAGLGQSVVMAGMTGLREGDPDQMALQVAFLVLGEGKLGNRLFNTIRTQQGMAYVVASASHFRHTVPGVFLAYAVTQGKNTPHVVKSMQSVCQTLAQNGITQEEWESARQAILQQEAFHGASLSNLLAYQMALKLFGQPMNTMHKKLAQLKTLDLKTINETIQRRFRPEQLRFYVLGDAQAFPYQQMGDVVILEQ